MFSEKSVLFRYYRNVTDSYRKKVMTIHRFLTGLTPFSYRFISKNRVYFGTVSVSDRFVLGTVDE